MARANHNPGLCGFRLSLDGNLHWRRPHLRQRKSLSRGGAFARGAVGAASSVAEQMKRRAQSFAPLDA
jgi:hypothetical protein